LPFLCKIVSANYRPTPHKFVQSKFPKKVLDTARKMIIIVNMKNKKPEKTKATLVKEVEQKFRLAKGTLDSLERANKETIVKLLSL
jgi:hypothetical protein